MLWYIIVKCQLLEKALSVSSMSSMPTENCWLFPFDIVSDLIVRSNFALARHEAPSRPVQYVKPPEGIMQRKLYDWMGELKYIVIDGCMLLNWSSSTISDNCKERTEKTSSSVKWCRQNSDFNCRKTEKNSQMKLATGACKNWISVSFLLTTFHVVYQ